MKYIRTYILRGLFIISLMLGFVACNDSDDNSESNNKARRTLIVYMAAQNSLGYNGYAKEDSIEIAEGAIDYLSLNDNIIMFIDDAKNPRIHRLYRNQADGKCYYKTVYQYNYDANSGDASTLLDVLSRVHSLYPSESYGLVMWSHGTGWMPEIVPSSNQYRAIGIDVGPGGNMSKDKNADGALGTQMSIESMASAIQQSGIHFDYIFFDACLMQSLEVAYALRHVTDYLVASPTQTGASGAYYKDQIRDGFFVYPTNDTNIKKIVDTYYFDVMENPITKGNYPDQGCIMSVIKMSEMDNLAEATKPCMKIALKDSRVTNLSQIMTGYVGYLLTGYPDCYDPSVAFSKLVSSVEYETWRSALDRCVIYKKASEKYFYGSDGRRNMQGITDMEHCSCVSMFFPQDSYDMYIGRNYLDYNNAIKETEWYKIVWPENEK